MPFQPTAWEWIDLLSLQDPEVPASASMTKETLMTFGLRAKESDRMRNIVVFAQQDRNTEVALLCKGLPQKIATRMESISMVFTGVNKIEKAS